MKPFTSIAVAIFSIVALTHLCRILARNIHGHICCNRGFAAMTGGLAVQSVDVLQRVRLPSSRLHAPVSRRDCAVSRRSAMNIEGLGWDLVIAGHGERLRLGASGVGG